MPAEGLPWLNRSDLLTYEELERIVATPGLSEDVYEQASKSLA